MTVTMIVSDKVVGSIHHMNWTRIMDFIPKLILIARSVKKAVTTILNVGLLNAAETRIIQRVPGGNLISVQIRILLISLFIRQNNTTMAILATKVSVIIF